MLTVCTTFWCMRRLHDLLPSSPFLRLALPFFLWLDVPAIAMEKPLTQVNTIPIGIFQFLVFNPNGPGFNTSTPLASSAMGPSIYSRCNCDPPAPLLPDLQEAIRVRESLVEELDTWQSIHWSSTLGNWWNMRILFLLPMWDGSFLD